MGLFDMIRVCPNCREAVKTGMTGKCPICKSTTILPESASDMTLNRTPGQWKEMSEQEKKDFVEYALNHFEKKNNYVYLLDNGAGDTLTVQENYCVLNHRGAMNSLVMGGMKGEKRINYQSITAIEFKKPTGFSLGYIQFTIPGGREQQGGVFDANRDENSIAFNISFVELAETIVNYIEDQRIKLSTPQASTVVQQMSTADELKKFKELLDAGIITQEEFDAKKKQLLGL